MILLISFGRLARERIFSFTKYSKCSGLTRSIISVCISVYLKTDPSEMLTHPKQTRKKQYKGAEFDTTTMMTVNDDISFFFFVYLPAVKRRISRQQQATSQSALLLYEQGAHYCALSALNSTVQVK